MDVDYRKKVERKLGRKLTKYEIIHHKDGDDHHNARGNLKVTTRPEHGREKHLSRKERERRASRYAAQYIINANQMAASDLNKKLSMFFTPRQKEIIFMKLLKKRLSKTESEIFSRIIKKKLKAMSNPTLFRTAGLIVCEM